MENIELTEEELAIKQMNERFRGFFPVVVDVETAGFNAQTDALLQLSGYTLKFLPNGTLVKDKSFNYEIQPFPNAKIEQANINFIGIDPFDPNRKALDEKLSIIPFCKEIAKEVKRNKCKRAILVGHNANFDQGFLNAAIARLGYKRSPFHPFSVIDTASLCAIFLGQTVLKLSCEIVGIDFDDNQAHGAAYDTDREAELFCWIVNNYKNLGGWPLSQELQERTKIAQTNINYCKNKNENKSAEEQVTTEQTE